MSFPPTAVADVHPSPTMVREALVGLRKTPKHLPAKFFYDETGSALFDRITELNAYYPTRTETAIMEAHIEAMVEKLGPTVRLVEFGSGSSVKTRILLDHLRIPAGYVPIDISEEHLLRVAADLQAVYPSLHIAPLAADYTEPLALPEMEARRTVVYFPGSTIGNFTPVEARAFLERSARMAGPNGGLLIGVDLRKDEAVLTRAYNDEEGVTAAFNKNMLAHLNHRAGANFNLDQFAHRAFFDAENSRIEMRLVSLVKQTVRLGGQTIPFAEGEEIVTEYSYKYTLPRFAELAAAAGWRVMQVWTDVRDYFSVQYLEVVGD